MIRPVGGFSLIETVIALVILGGGLLVIAAGAARSVSWLRQAESIAGANVSAISVLDSLAQHEAPSDGSSVRGFASLRWITSAGTATTRITLYASYADGVRIREDTFTAIAARWPRRLNRVP